MGFNVCGTEWVGWVGAGGGWKLTHANVVLAAITPDVIWHLESTNRKQLICFCPLGSPLDSTSATLATAALQRAHTEGDKEWLTNVPIARPGQANKDIQLSPGLVSNMCLLFDYVATAD